MSTLFYDPNQELFKKQLLYAQHVKNYSLSIGTIHDLLFLIRTV